MKNSPLFVISVFLILQVFCLPAASKGNHGHGTITVTISPSTSSLQVGQSQQFTANVSGTGNKALNWLVNGTPGGNATVGTVSSYGVYAAPAVAPSSSVTVTAQSAVQPSASASATVSIAGAPPVPVSVSLSPSSTSLQLGQSQQFTATVSGTSNTAVSWSVNGTPGGISAVGTISSSGLYTAPATMPSSPVTVTATSMLQSTARGSATVSLTAPPPISVSISPTSASVEVRQSQQFGAQVYGTTNTAVNWLVSGVVGGNSSLGTISSTGLYTAPATVPTSKVIVTAQCAYSPSVSANAGVTVMAPVAHSVNLSWTASTASPAGYNIYRGTQPTGPFTRINPALEPATVYADNNVVSGQTYYYATTAVDSSGVESGYSNTAQAIIP
jgi:hypothetical protein